MPSTTSKGFKRDSSNSKWITKEKFDEVFPRGYRECNFFSTPVEFWSMSKEACWNWKQTALLDLSSKLSLQKNLQQTFIIGHSSDTKLLTELLSLNNKDSKIEYRNTNSTINNNVNMVTDVLFKEIYKNKKCYTCNNICKCSRLHCNRLKNILGITNDETVLSKTQLILPEIELIDQFDKSSLRKNKLKLSNYILDNNDVSVTNITKPDDISENSYLLQNESDGDLENMCYDNYLSLPVETGNNIRSRPTTPLENIVVNEKDSRQIIQDESTTDDSNGHENVLRYFHLQSISDIFQNLEDDDDDDWLMVKEFNEINYS